MGSQSGSIIYFDGPDGVGKTTQLRMVAEKLRQAGRSVHATRTMGGTPIGEMLREAMLSGNERPVETDLYIALASQYSLAKEVLEQRRQGKVVLIDRSPLSIIAYQVYGDELDPEKGAQAARELIELVKPDRIIVYKAPKVELKARRRQRNHEIGTDFFEIKPFEYHARVAEGFKSAAEQFQAKVIDANASIEQVHDDTIDYLSELLML